MLVFIEIALVPLGGGHCALPAGRRRHLGGVHRQAGGDVRGAPGAILEDGPPSAEEYTKGDAESRDGYDEDEV